MSVSIGILTHSTNPRGGVVHAMALAETLCDAGYNATLIAPDETGAGFFRTPRCPVWCIPVMGARSLPALVEHRISEVRQALRMHDFDVLHAQDPITANALADLVHEGWIPGFARTVHHLDSFEHPELRQRQERGFMAASEVLSVSKLWKNVLQNTHGCTAPVVGNGVDSKRFTSRADERDTALRVRYHLPEGKRLILSVGGIEPRKNTRLLLEAFSELCQEQADLHLVVAGGASLLDHSAYRAAFDRQLHESGLTTQVSVTGPVADEDMPALYRQAAVLAYPSQMEGFGLCPLEALACGTPVIVPRAAPFTEHLTAADALWCDPAQPHSLLRSLRAALSAENQAQFLTAGPITAQRFDWSAVARRHFPAYRRLAALSGIDARAFGDLSSCPK